MKHHTAMPDGPKKPVAAVRIIIFGFLCIILLGTILLMLPVSSRAGTFTDWETASFTAVSATCITGLSIVDTMTYWSTFGQLVIILMIQVGGLGFMTLALLFSMLLNRAITPRERLITSQALGLDTYEDTPRMVRHILIGTFSIEGIGALLLATQYVPLFGWKSGIFRSLFTAVSAFCNAGFDLMGDYSGPSTSLMAFRANPMVNFTIIGLIVLGGIGFLVWEDVVLLITQRKKFRVYTKFVLIITAILIFGGTAAVFFLEYSNPATLGDLPLGEKLLAALFHSVSTRTAGFFTVDNVGFRDATILISVMLMLTGGASASAAGGLKAGTVGLVVYAMIQTALGHSEIVLFRRKISKDAVLRAMSLVAIGVTLTAVATLIISEVEGMELLPVLYEVASALATVGLSQNLTASLGTMSHLLLMALMFLGRIGILSLTYAITLRSTDTQQEFTYPETNLLIG